MRDHVDVLRKAVVKAFKDVSLPYPGEPSLENVDAFMRELRDMLDRGEESPYVNKVKEVLAKIEFEEAEGPANPPKCKECGKEAQFRCSQCGAASYCCEECQVGLWSDLDCHTLNGVKHFSAEQLVGAPRALPRQPAEARSLNGPVTNVKFSLSRASSFALLFKFMLLANQNHS